MSLALRSFTENASKHRTLGSLALLEEIIRDMICLWLSMFHSLFFRFCSFIESSSTVREFEVWTWKYFNFFVADLCFPDGTMGLNFG